MSLSLTCYSYLNINELTHALNSIKNLHSDLFSNTFLITKPMEIDDFYQECLNEYAYSAKSVFLVIYNDKSSIDKSQDMIFLLKDFFQQNLLILFENETVM